MSFLAKLELEYENNMNVLHCGFRLTQITDRTGKATAIPQGGTISLVLESDGGNSLFDWMISPTLTRTGKIFFYRRDSMSCLKVLEFTDALCVDYYETFNHLGDHPMQIQLTLSARKLTMNGDSEFENNWPVN